MAKQKIYIPTYISSIDYKPARVLPRIFFYNGLLDTDTFYIQNNYGEAYAQTAFPYFDNYLGSLPTTSSLSLLFNNEQSVYGETPLNSLYSEYWSTYVNLLYNPRTRLINCSAIIPLANYFKLNLNDIVEWRGNYYHLRAINNYNLSNGECTLQLLGPIIGDTLAYILPGEPCKFDFEISDPPPTYIWNVTKCDDSITYYGVTFDTTSSLSTGSVIKWGTPGELDGCYKLTPSFAEPDLTGSIIYSIYNSCEECLPPPPPPPTIYELVNCSTSASVHVTFAFTPPLTGKAIKTNTVGLSGSCWLVNNIESASIDYSDIEVADEYIDCITCSTPPPPCACTYYNIVVTSHDIDASTGNDVHPYWNNTVWVRYHNCNREISDEVYNAADNYYHAICCNLLDDAPYLYYHINDVPTTDGLTSTIDQSPDCCGQPYYVVDVYDVNCDSIDTVVISNSVALDLGKFYATSELAGPVINVISMTSTYPDYFTNINTGGYNTCQDVPPL